MNDNILMICASEALHAAANAGTDPVDWLRAAMKATANHWMALDEDTQFRGALAGAMQHAKNVGDETTVTRLTHEIGLLRGLAAATSGVPVDFAALFGDEDAERPAPFGVTKIWREIKHGAAP